MNTDKIIDDFDEFWIDFRDNWEELDSVQEPNNDPDCFDNEVWEDDFDEYPNLSEKLDKYLYTEENEQKYDDNNT